MHNGGPFNQASSNKYKLMNYIRDAGFPEIMTRCKFLHAVWFPSVSELDIRRLTLPPEADKSLILTKAALENPLPPIQHIFSIELPNGVTTDLSAQDEKHLLREILCPHFNVFPSVSFDSELKKIVFHRLLKEQAGILNFLDEQRTAVINGAAGTGKTMIAVEKARRHANDGQRVLFLCYNAQLKSHLSENYGHANIDYYTVSGLACKLCNSKTPDYPRCKSILEDMYLSDSFPYRHVVIDEGQDFGSEVIEETDILGVLNGIVKDNAVEDGSFYVFYDKLQLVQAKRMPKYIDEADCRLTLYRNCRNTENIAATSLRPISERKPKLFEGAVKGAPARMHFCSDSASVVEAVNKTIESLKADGFRDIVILTCATEADGILSPETKNGLYRNKYLYTTCRKFKGLEADAVILTDVTHNTFNAENVLLYYVGASRARLRLDIIAVLSDNDCAEILANRLRTPGKIKNPKRGLAGALNAVGILSS